MRAAAALGCVLVAVLAGSLPAAATLAQKQSVAASPAAVAPVNALAAGATGTTTLGASLASATTTKSGLLVTFQEVLKVKKGASDWDVRLQYVSSSGFGVLDSATVRLVGATTQTQVAITLGSLTQSTGTVVDLAPAGSDAGVQVSGTKTSLGSLVLTLQVVLVPHGKTQPVVVESYVLTIT